MRTKVYLLAAASAAAILLSGCAKKPAPAPTLSAWTSAKYHLTASYSSDWKYKDVDAPEDVKTGKMKIVYFVKPDNLTTDSLVERPPVVSVMFMPIPQGVKIEPDPTAVVAGWNEFGATDIKTRSYTTASGVPAVEGTAHAKAGTAFFSTYTGQLVGIDQYIRVVELHYSTGIVEITRAAPKEYVAEADAIVDSITTK